MSGPAKPYLFVNPNREVEAVRYGSTRLHGIPIQVHVAVPVDELWWGEELPTELEIVGDEVRSVSRIRIIHKLKLA